MQMYANIYYNSTGIIHGGYSETSFICPGFNRFEQL